MHAQWNIYMPVPVRAAMYMGHNRISLIHYSYSASPWLYGIMVSPAVDRILSQKPPIHLISNMLQAPLQLQYSRTRQSDLQLCPFSASSSFCAYRS